MPHVSIHVLSSKYAAPIQVIAFMDTGSFQTIMNPDVLPPEEWEKHKAYFRAANGVTFSTKLRTKKEISIQFFPGCIVWTKVLGSSLPDNDLLVRFRDYRKASGLRILPDGLRFKALFKPFIHTTKVFAITDPTLLDFEPIRALIQKSCAYSHSQFNYPKPLWANPDFFITLSFKLNKDINPTKATHTGMTPTDLKLAQEECSQLLAQGLIEPTKSQWVCQAFYVEKRSETIRGKKRFVIAYKPLNHFLRDDKFPLPRISSLFVHLSNACIFSKFDLKAGFWQLGIHPDDRHKTALCIPTAQYQWKVMPFGLKTASSIFQRSMMRIFEPILYSALIYIDDILLFSKDVQSHTELLTQFHSLVEQYSIMLSEKKSTIGISSIEFLGMQFKDGHYVPSPHIAQELLKFPDKDFTVKRIQQFLGTVNFLREFIPHVSIHTSQPSKMTRKMPPSWGPTQTEAVKQLKQIAQSPPPFKIPGDGHHILQTEASDEYWGAVLIEYVNETDHYCGHASGQFKESEKHYHSTIKEVLPVKYEKKKFEFHLVPHHFTVRMDNSAFPKILDFQNKSVPSKHSTLR